MGLAEFSKNYRKLVRRLWPRTVPGRGWSEQDLNNVEHKLGFQLPTALRTFYSHYGRLEAINKAYHVLLDPQELRVCGEYLVFYEIHQETGYWGLADYRHSSDPAVYACYNHNRRRPKWHLDHDHLSDFLITMFCWQAVNGGAPYGGYAYIDRSTIKQLKSDFPKMPLKGHRLGFQVFGDSGPILCLVEGDLPVTLEVGAATKRDLRDTADRYNLEWIHTWPE